MYRNWNDIDAFQFDGIFYTEDVEKQDDGSLLDETDDLGGSLLDEDGGGDTAPVAETPQAETTINVVLATKCDILEARKMFSSGSLIADYEVYWPIPKEDVLDEDGNVVLKAGTTNVRRGQRFRCENYKGIAVDGLVVGIFASDYGFNAEIKEVDTE